MNAYTVELILYEWDLTEWIGSWLQDDGLAVVCWNDLIVISETVQLLNYEKGWNKVYERNDLDCDLWMNEKVEIIQWFIKFQTNTKKT